MIPDQRRLTPVLGSPALDCRRRLSRLPLVIFNPGKAPATKAPSAVSPRAYATVVNERLGPNQNGSLAIERLERAERPPNEDARGVSRPTKAPTRPSTSVSAKSWATTRPRSAPSATRTRISRSRVAALTTTSRATLAAIRIRNRMKRPLLDMSPTDTELEMSITASGEGQHLRAQSAGASRDCLARPAGSRSSARLAPPPGSRPPRDGRGCEPASPPGADSSTRSA